MKNGNCTWPHSVGFDESSLWLTYWDGNQWLDAEDTCPPVSVSAHDLDANTLRLPICRLGEFALLGDTEQRIVYLPLVMR